MGGGSWAAGSRSEKSAGSSRGGVGGFRGVERRRVDAGEVGYVG